MTSTYENQRDIIVVGASAGGVEALKTFLKHLPVELEVAVLIVLHIPEHSRSRLSEILQRETAWKVSPAKDGEHIVKGKVYVAGANAHMLVENYQIVLGKGPKENRFRPSIDALFRSAAYNYRQRVIGILLSGSMDDGNSGLWTIKRLGGLAIVQDVQEAVFPQMIMNAKHYVDIDYEVSVDEMGNLLKKIIEDSSSPEVSELSEEEAKLLELEIIVAKKDNSLELGILEKGVFTPITCPECHGALVQLKEGKVVRFRCHTGHAFTISSLMAGISKAINEQLWQSMKSMEENAILLEKLSALFLETGYEQISQSYSQKAQEYRDKSRQVHAIILSHNEISGDPEEFRPADD